MNSLVSLFKSKMIFPFGAGFVLGLLIMYISFAFFLKGSVNDEQGVSGSMVNSSGGFGAERIIRSEAIDDIEGSINIFQKGEILNLSLDNKLDENVNLEFVYETNGTAISNIPDNLEMMTRVMSKNSKTTITFIKPIKFDCAFRILKDNTQFGIRLFTTNRQLYANRFTVSKQ